MSSQASPSERRDCAAAYRRVTVEAETVYPTDLLLRWLVGRWRSWRSAK